MFINLFSLKKKFNERRIKSILNQVKIVLKKKKRSQNEKQILLSVSLCCSVLRDAGNSLAVDPDLPGSEPFSAPSSPLQNHSNPSGWTTSLHITAVLCTQTFSFKLQPRFTLKKSHKVFQVPKELPNLLQGALLTVHTLQGRTASLSTTPCVGAALRRLGILQHTWGKHSSSACRAPLILSQCPSPDPKGQTTTGSSSFLLSKNSREE